MPDLALSLIRTAVQMAWGYLAALAIAHGLALSRTAPDWAVQAGTALVMLAAVAALRYVEHRWPRLGRILMATIEAVPRYVRPDAPTPAPVTPITRTGGGTTPPAA